MRIVTTFTIYILLRLSHKMTIKLTLLNSLRQIGHVEQCVVVIETLLHKELVAAVVIGLFV